MYFEPNDDIEFQYHPDTARSMAYLNFEMKALLVGRSKFRPQLLLDERIKQRTAVYLLILGRTRALSDCYERIGLAQYSLADDEDVEVVQDVFRNWPVETLNII
jgi:hypothetical protein